MEVFILLEEFLGVSKHRFGFPGIVVGFPALPFDPVLPNSVVPPAGVSVFEDGFHFPFFFIIDYVRWGSKEVCSVCKVFFVRHKKGGMEYVVDAPSSREL